MVWKPLNRLLSIGSSKSSKGSTERTPQNKDIGNDSQSSHVTTNEHGSASATPVSSNLEPTGSDIEKADKHETNAPLEDVISVEEASVTLRDNTPSQAPEVNARTVLNATPTLPDKEASDVTEPEERTAPSTPGPCIKNYPFTKNHNLMDDMLDGMLMMRSFITETDARRGKIANNAEAVAKVKAEGIKIRDFAAQPATTSATTPKDDSTSLHQDNPVVELFLAREKLLQFFYMHFLVKNGVYDLPSYPFTVDDVDRLHTCGLIGPRDLDDVLLCSMLGHGAYRRSIRSSGMPFFNGEVLPPRGQWTIPLGQERPTVDEINRYIALHEAARHQRRYAVNMYRIAAFERPKMTEEYIRHRVDRDGFWGLKRLAGLSDDQAVELSKIKDTSYIPTKTYLEKWSEKFPRTKVIALPLPQLEDSFIGSASLQQVERPSSVPADHISADAPQPSLTSSVLTPSKPLSSSPPNAQTLPSNLEHGCSPVAKGKKRSRSPSPSFEEDNDDSLRRTRARLAEELPSPGTGASTSTTSSLTTNAGAVSPVERTLRRSTRSIAGKVTVPEASTSQAPSRTSTPVPAPLTPSPKGKKRSRDDEPEVELPGGGSSPPKKAKSAEDAAPIRPIVPGPSGAPPTDLIPAKVADASAGPSDPPSTESGTGSTPPATTGSTNPTTAGQPRRRVVRRQKLMKYNPATNQLEDLVTGEVMSMNPEHPDWPADVEQAKVYGGLEGRFEPTWAELCSRKNAAGSIAFADIKPVSTVPQSQPQPQPQSQPQSQPQPQPLPQPQPQPLPQPQSQASGSATTPSPPAPGASEVAQPPAPSRGRPLQRQHMVYLDEVFPQYHPRWYGRSLVRQPMRYLDEVLPDMFPKWVPSESTT